MAPAGPGMIGGTAAPALTSHFSVNQPGGDSWLSEHLGGVGAETEAPRGTEADTGADSDSLLTPLLGQPHQGSSPTRTL